MRSVSCLGIVISVCVLFVLPLRAAATPAITCHCFTDRSFDPGSPAKADPYFRATAQNTFMALVFNCDKKSIVMKKQQGTSSDDMWVAFWVAAHTSSSADVLLQKKGSGGAWKNICPQVKTLGPRFLTALNANAGAARLAEIVADEQIVRHRLLTSTDVAALRQEAVSSQDLILAGIVSAKTRLPARQVYLEVKRGTKTWGSFLSGAGLDAGNLAHEMSAVLKTQSTVK
jgi:hypothetical protein